MRLFVLSLLAGLLAAFPITADAKVIFSAVCGDLRGMRVDMDPEDGAKPDKWKDELYPAGAPPKGTGTLKFVSDDTDNGLVRMSWSANTEALLPVVFKSDTQITLADVDETGVWLFSLYPRTDRVIVTRQTADSGPGIIGAVLVAKCEFSSR